MMKYGRALLRDVAGYVPGEQPQGADVVKLNTNENPYPPSPCVMEALRGLGAEGLRRYPDPDSGAFRAAFARRHGLPGPEWVVAGNGMDELLAMAMRTFVDPGDAVLTTYPTYTLYETLAQLHGACIVKQDLDEAWQLPAGFASTPARLCLVPRPNAPSGVCPARGEMEALCESFDGLVVIDEAYVDFAEDHCLDFPERFENVVVMRTFSKSYSLAGMRLGAAVARPELAAEFMKTKDSYNLNAVAQAVGVAALADWAYMEANAARVRDTRARLVKGLTVLGFETPPSQANFVLAQWRGEPPAGALFEQLRDQGILVRYFDAPRLRDALRISVGTDTDTEALLDALRGLVG